MEPILPSKAEEDVLRNCRSITFGKRLGKGQAGWGGSSSREGWGLGKWTEPGSQSPQKPRRGLGLGLAFGAEWEGRCWKVLLWDDIMQTALELTKQHLLLLPKVLLKEPIKMAVLIHEINSSTLSLE